MFENIIKFFKRLGKKEKEDSKNTAKERLHLVLAQDRANISADFLEMMKQEIIDVIKKYIEIDEEAIDVRMANKLGEDGTIGAPALYANIPILTIKNETRKMEGTIKEKEEIEEVAVDEDKKTDEQQTDEQPNEELVSEKTEETTEDKKEESLEKLKAENDSKSEEDNNIDVEEVKNEEKNS